MTGTDIAKIALCEAIRIAYVAQVHVRTVQEEKDAAERRRRGEPEEPPREGPDE